MSAETPVSNSIFALLSADPTISSLVGIRIYADVAPFGTQDPWIAYQRISNQREQSHDGYDGMSISRYQFAAYSSVRANVEAIREALLDLFDGKANDIDGEHIVTLHANDHDAWDGETKTFATHTDFSVSRNQ